MKPNTTYKNPSTGTTFTTSNGGGQVTVKPVAKPAYKIQSSSLNDHKGK